MPKIKGYSLVELMISIAVGLIVTGGITAIFATTLKNNADTLKMTRLNQELRGIMDIMVRDIRRAGYCGTPGGCAANPFTAAGGNNLRFNDNGLATQGSCITYTYDVPFGPSPAGLGLLNTTGGAPVERFGFRLNDEDAAVSMRTGGNTLDCTPSATPADSNIWENISDENEVEITGLQFAYTDMDNNATTPNTPRCVNTADGNSQRIRGVTITLSGRLVDDASVKRTLVEAVHLPNDRIVPGTC